MRICSLCKREQAEERYSPDGRLPSGLQSQCKGCRTINQKRYYANNRRDILARAHDAYCANPEPVRAAYRIYYWNNRNERSAAARRWAVEHPDLRRKYEADYREANRERVRYYTKHYYARRRANGGYIGYADWLERCAEFGNRCAYCASAGPLEMEHITPVSRGGTHTLDNVVPACVHCNRSKHNRGLLQFMLRRVRMAEVA